MKNIICKTALTAAVILAVCFIFTQINLAVFKNFSDEIPHSVCTAYICENIHVTDSMSAGAAVIRIELDDNENGSGATLKIQHYIEYAWGGSPDHHREVHITDFEKCLLFDYAKLVLKIYDEDKDRKPLFVNGNLSLVVRPNYGDWGKGIYTYAAGNAAVNIFIIAELTMVYIRNILPLFLLAFVFLGAFIYSAGEKYFIGQSISAREKLFRLCKMAEVQLKFMAWAIIITGILSFVFTNTRYYWLKYAGTYSWDYLLRFDIAIKSGLVLITTQTVVLMLMAEDKKLLRGVMFMLPSFIMMYIHKLFYSCEQRDIKFAFEDKLFVYMDCFPFYPRLFNFVLFFFAAFPLFFVFSRSVDKSVRRSLAWAVTQAAANAFLTCLAAYAVQLSVRMWGPSI